MLSAGGPVYTPHGLKIRLSTREAFSMMGLLYPQVRPKQILLTTEAVDTVPVVTSHGAFLIALYFGASPLTVIGITVIANLWGIAVVWLGAFFLAPGAVTIGRWINCLCVNWLRYIAMPILAYLMAGWVGVVTWLGAWVLAMLAGIAFEYGLASYYYRKVGREGLAWTGAEIAFLQACRLHAMGLGMNPMQFDRETEGADWLAPATDYALEYPGRLPGFSP